MALETEELSETDSGYDGPLSFARTALRSFAMSSAFVYRSAGSLAIALSTMRSSAGGSPGISSLTRFGFSVMILKKRFCSVGPSNGFRLVRS